MLRFSPLALAVPALLAIAAAPCRGAKPALPPLDPNDFALMPWGVTAGVQEVFDGIRDCGFNVAGFVAPDQLDRAHKAGLKAIVHDNSIHVDDAAATLDDATVEKRMRAVAKKTAGHPATWGYYLRDEPAASLYPALARAAAAVRKEAPGTLPYINLFPLICPCVSLPSREPHLRGLSRGFRHHRETRLHQLRPLCADGRRLASRRLLPEPGVGARARRCATTCRSGTSCWATRTSTTPSPRRPTLRFQAYTTLAYGARGISYFTYFTSTTGNYRLAPVDQFGNSTPTWDMLRHVNLQIRMLGADLCHSSRASTCSTTPTCPPAAPASRTSRFVDSVTGGGSYARGRVRGPGRRPVRDGG